MFGEPLDQTGQPTAPPRRRRPWLWAGAALLVLCFSAALGWLAWRCWPRPMPGHLANAYPRLLLTPGAVTVHMLNGHLLARVGSYDNELTAYLRFQYLGALQVLAAHQVLMATREANGEPRYQLYVRLPNDLAQAATVLQPLLSRGSIDDFSFVTTPGSQVYNWLQQTALFSEAYGKPVEKKLLSLPRDRLQAAVTRFVLFKARTDRRVREQLVPEPTILSRQQSERFAADMIDVAQFYNLPLSMLLGVGAMENNYLNVQGDLQHTAWKRHAQPGDIVLRRGRGRVLVKNFSLGRWQITLETLRSVHALYLADSRPGGRDYSQLPPRLQPPKILDLSKVDPEVLTTYAGLLLRHLLDQFHGDEAQAIGAYNGGPAHPNAQYAQGVTLVADYAHQVLALAVQQHADAVEKTRLTGRRLPHHPAAASPEPAPARLAIRPGRAMLPEHLQAN